MNQSRKKLAPNPTRVFSEEYLNFRLCHVCLYLSESDQEIMKCDKCQVEFLVTEDPNDREPLSADDFAEDAADQGDDGKRRPASPVPLNGLTVRW